MNNIITLTKVAFRSNFRANSSKQKKSKISGGVVIGLFIFLGIYMAAAMGMLFMGIASMLKDAGKSIYFIEILAYILATVMMLFFTTFQSHAQIFKAKDLDMLRAMPVTPFQILMSKLTSLYLSNLLFGAVILIPAGVVHLVFEGFSVYTLSVILIGLIVAPCVAMTVSFILAFLISFLPENSVFIKILAVLLSLGLFGIYFVFIGQMGSFIESFAVNGEAVIQAINTYYFPAALLSTAFQGSWLGLLGFAASSIAIVAVAGYILSRTYFGILNKKVSSSKGHKRVDWKNQRQNSIVKAVFRKELKKYFSSVLYIMNTIMGAFLLVIFAGATIFGNSIMEGFSEINASVPGFTFIIVLVASLALCSMTCTTSTSISLEGKNLWILSTSPINCFDIFKGKIMVNLLVVLPLWLISSVIFFFTIKLSVAEWALMFIAVCAMIVTVSVLGILINLLFPKLDAIDDTQVIKQSLSSFLGIFSGMILLIPVLIFVFMTLFAQMNTLIIVSIVALYFILLAIITILLLKKFGAVLFYKLKA